MSGGKRFNCDSREGSPPNNSFYGEIKKAKRLDGSGNLGLLAEVSSNVAGGSSLGANDTGNGSLGMDALAGHNVKRSVAFDWVNGSPAERLRQVASFIEYRNGNLGNLASLLCNTIRGIASELGKNGKRDSVSSNITGQNDLQQVLNDRLKCLEDFAGTQKALFNSVNQLSLALNGKVIPTVSSIQTKEVVLESEIRKIRKSSAEIGNQLASNSRGSRKFEVHSGAFRCPPENLCILSKPSRSAVERLEKRLEEHPDIKSGKFKYDFINKHPNGNVYVHCNSLESQKGISSIIVNSGTNVKVRGIRKDFVYLRFGPIRTVDPTEVVIEEIMAKDDRFRGRKDSLALFKRFKDRRDPLKIYLVYKVDYDLSQTLLRNPFTHYKERIRISRFRPLLHCHKCSRFGHSFNFCRFKEICCPNCAGGHLLSACSSLSRKCGNCCRLGKDDRHCSWETVCPVRTRFMERLLKFDSVDLGVT